MFARPARALTAHGFEGSQMQAFLGSNVFQRRSFAIYMRRVTKKFDRRVDRPHKDYVSPQYADRPEKTYLNKFNPYAVQLNLLFVECKTTEEILQQFEVHEADLSHVNLATAAHKLAKVGKFVKVRPSANAPVSNSSALALKEKDLEIELRGLSPLQQDVRLKRFMEKLEKSVEKTWKNRMLANTCFAVSKMGPLTPGAQDVLKACARVLPRKEKHLNTIDISNIGWAFATMKNADKEVFETLSSVAVQRIEECNSQDLANLAWAFATAEVRDSALFGAVAKKSVQTMEHFNAQDLSNTAWAFSTANQAHEQLLFSAIASESMRKMVMFNPQNLANLAWAFAKPVGWKGHTIPLDLFSAISREAIATVADFRPQAMANIVWAFSTAGVKDAALCDAVAVEAVRRIGTFDAKALTFTARAFSRAGHAAPALFDAIAAQIEKRIREFNRAAVAQAHTAFFKSGNVGMPSFQAALKMAQFLPQDAQPTKPRPAPESDDRDVEDYGDGLDPNSREEYGDDIPTFL